MAGSFQNIVAYFTEKHKDYEVDEGRQVLRAQLVGDHASFRISVGWNERSRRVTFWVANVVTIPKAMRDSACVLANLINWKIAQGNFEIDMDNGELAYKLAFHVSDGTLGPEQIGDNLGSVLRVTDRYYPALHRFLWVNLTPKEALASMDNGL